MECLSGLMIKSGTLLCKSCASYEYQKMRHFKWDFVQFFYLYYVSC